MSTRRIPKGPGRRPKSLARRRFIKLLNKGVYIRAACREIGVCRQTGQNWKNGVTVTRKNGSVKHVPLTCKELLVIRNSFHQSAVKYNLIKNREVTIHA